MNKKKMQNMQLLAFIIVTLNSILKLYPGITEIAKIRSKIIHVVLTDIETGTTHTTKIAPYHIRRH